MIRTFRQFIESQISLGQFEGDLDSEFQAANLMMDGKQVGRINFGIHKIMQGVVDGELSYKTYGSIDDVWLSVRGTNAMSHIYPEVEKRLRQAGAEYIRLNTVDDAVAQKVWAPLGFQRSGSIGRTKTWAKPL